MLTINLEFDANAMAAPQSFRDGVNEAATILEAAIYDPITVNIEVGYGEYDLGGPEYTQLSGGESLGGVTSTIGLSYQDLRLALAMSASSATDAESVQALPNTASLDGQSSFAIAPALAKAFGVISPTASAIDGNVGFPTNFTGNTLINAAITEEAHALGLLNYAGDLGLFAYSSPGVHYLSTGQPTMTPAYFSVDGGSTNLANYDVAYDDTLFSNRPNDPLDVPDQNATVLTSLDLTELSAIGFDVSSMPTLPTPAINPTYSSSNSEVVVTGQNVNVPENHSVSALSLIQAVAAPIGDYVTTYSFDDTGNDGGHLLFDGVVEPNGQNIAVLATQLPELTYVGGSTPGQETIDVYAFGTSTSVSSQISPITATTTPAVVPNLPSADFNGDGTSDILFQNTNGTVDTWEVNNASVFASNAIANPGTQWHEAGTGDFNGDGTSDILYQNDDGTVAIWELNGPSVILGATVANPGTAWHVLGTGDFDKDGKSDILLQNNDGTVEIWNMNGASIAGSAVVANPGTQWHPIGTGDFFGTGQPDILLQNDDGTIDIWQMSGDTLVNGTVVANPGPTWHAVGTGDFNGDGHADIVFQNNDGSVAIWEMNGTSVIASATLGNPGPTWHVVSTGDYNGDGKSDILFQNNDGTVATWLMNGTTVTAGDTIANPGTQWQTTGQGSLNFIDGTQSTGTLNGTILSDDFVLTTSLSGAHAIAGFDPLHDTITLNQAQFPTYAAVQAAETVVNGSTVITLGNNDTLTLNGVLPGALAAKNFV